MTGKLLQIGPDWGAKAALKDAMDFLPEDAQVLVLFRQDETFTVGYRSANVDNAKGIAMMEEFKFIIHANAHGIEV